MAERILRFKNLTDPKDKNVGPRATIYRMIHSGEFPRPFPIGGARRVGWLESQVDAWLEERAAKGKERAA